MVTQVQADLTPETRTRLSLVGIDPTLAEGRLAPYAERLTPALVKQAMDSTTWSPNAGGGARLSHLLKYLGQSEKAADDAEARHTKALAVAKTTASRMARAVRERVNRQGLAPWIALWAYTLTPEPVPSAKDPRRRAIEYVVTYGSPLVRDVVAERYPDPLDCDWLRAVAWDDQRPGRQRTIAGALNLDASPPPTP